MAVKRFNVLVCHRRFGKTVWAINHMIHMGLGNKLKNPRYAYFAPLYGQVKRVAWDYLKEYTRNIPGVVVNEADLRVDIPRPEHQDTLRFQLFGADNPDSLRGIYLDGAVLDEYAQMHPSAWREVIRPALSDRLGWAIFIGTPKGKNAFYDLYRMALDEIEKHGAKSEWYATIFRASETGVVDPKELESVRRDMSEEEYEQEYECSFIAGIVGAYYAKIIAQLERDKRLTSVPYDPALAVDTFWDLGMSDTTSIWFVQSVNQEIRLIDYVEASGQSLTDYAKVLRAKGYYYGEIVLPHDAEVRELSSGRSRKQILQDLLPECRIRVLPRMPVADGINAVRVILPRCWFDSLKCRRGIEALTNYEREWDAKLQVFRDTPLHNWASNGADAFRYVALGLRKYARIDQSTLPRQAETDYDVFN
jgi:phage terminase large subunit